MKKDKISFPETVILIDTVLLNIVIRDFKQNFEKMLQRPLQKMDVAQFILNLALDANMPAGSKETQVIFVYDESELRLSHSLPSDLKSELDGVAFRDNLGEFIFAGLSAEGMVAREDLYFDLLHIISESADVKRIIVIPPEQSNKETLRATLEEIKGKEVILFGMSKPERDTSYTWQMLAYPVMQALGIKGDEMP